MFAASTRSHWIHFLNLIIVNRLEIKGRSFRGFNLFSEDDQKVLRAIFQGDCQGFCDLLILDIIYSLYILLIFNIIFFTKR
jgi:hypothetical protein